MGSFEDYALAEYGMTVEEWREMKANDPDPKEQRKANARSARTIYEQGIEFVERESYDGGAYNLLVNKALDLADDEKLIDLDFEMKQIKKSLVEDDGYTWLEVKKMFKFASQSLSVIKREMILAYPHLADYMRIRKSKKVSKFYKGTLIEEIEESAAINIEEGGDFAA